uniref:Uncharacterized protein n=1 Tax=Lates calcarifer TaxID=8187 RepID=A0A4W6C888_LATCA
MMRISGRVTTVQRLNSINDLKRINFGQSVPKHSLLLLHWFANEVDIDRNNVIRLTFDPDNEDYGSHHYSNYEGLLDPLPNGNTHQYYTVGNLNQGTSVQLPNYVTHSRREYEGENMDRIIFRVREPHTGQRVLQRIDRVFITQHYEYQETDYDPDHTYEITTDLLMQIRQFSVSVGEDQSSLIYDTSVNLDNGKWVVLLFCCMHLFFLLPCSIDCVQF